MPRFLFALALLLSLWPSPAAAGVCVPESELRAAAPAVETHYPEGALRSLSDTRPVSRIDTGIARSGERGDTRPPSSFDGYAAGRPGFAAAPGAVAPADPLRPGSAPIAPRLDHPPYYATAPPSAR